MADLPQPLHSGLGQATYQDLTEKLTTHYEHDSFFVAGGADMPRKIELFAIPENRPGNGFARKTFAETSLTLAGKLNRPMTVQEIRYELTPVGEAAAAPEMARFLLALRAHLQLNFDVNGTPAVGRRPLNHFSELGFSGATNLSGAVPEAVVGGVPTSRPERLRVLAAIPGKTRFRVELHLDQNVDFVREVPAGGGFVGTIYLGGTRQRVNLS